MTSCIIPKPEIKVRIPKKRSHDLGAKGSLQLAQKNPHPNKKAPIKKVISLAAFEGPAFFATSYNPNQWLANMAE